MMMGGGGDFGAATASADAGGREVAEKKVRGAAEVCIYTSSREKNASWKRV